MYGKVFQSIYDGTLAEDWRALITFQQMIILSDADGIIDMTPTAISRRTGIPIEHIKAGIEILEKPDPYSRTPDEDGRRIVLIDPGRPWGWQLVNHAKYRDFRSQEDRREYMRNYMKERREQEKSQENQTSCKQEGLHVNSSKQSLTVLANESVSLSVYGFDSFWNVYPKKVKKKTAQQTWKRKRLDAKAETIIPDVQNRLKKDGRWLEGFIPDPTTYLNQERWEDELTPIKEEKKPRHGIGKESDNDIIRRGKQLGINPKPGESMFEYNRRLLEAGRG